MGFCNQCGAPLRQGAAFCDQCGAPVALGSGMPQGAPSAVPMPPMPGVPDGTIYDAGPNVARPTASMPSMPSVPSSAVPPVSPAAPASPTAIAVDPKAAKRKRIILIVVAALAAVALIVAGIGFLGSRSDDSTGKPAAAATKKSTKSKKAQKTEKKFAFDSKKIDSIVKDAQPAAVAMATSDGKAEYSSSGAGKSGVASGLYLPVYLAATDNGKNPNTTASTMLKTMDNNAANQLIDQVGGLDALNDWLKKNGYEHTQYQRKFGDTAASAAGKENTTTAEDATNMLIVVDRIDAGKLMELDTSKEGITVPSSMTIHGHRGQGIGGAYNYYLIVKDGDRTVVVTVMTEQDKSGAAGLVNKLLEEIHQETNPEGEGEGNKSGDGNTAQNGDEGSGTATPVELTQSYTTQYGTVNAVTMPALTFQYPSDWTITDNTVNQYVEEVDLSNSRGVQLRYLYGMDGYSGCGRYQWSSDIAKVADAQFNAPAVQATQYDLGPFMVASFNDDMYALTPESMQGHHDFVGEPQCVLAFDWAGSTSFVVANNQHGLTDQERREVIAILASLKG
ncbi:serine hydrolase [Bifidobacterium parmae]|uniref:Beta-lactamase class A-like protein n=1 Tax=Bifidobacterium parmae TaxID=361854 RepID=A0A2N5J652_9BIFI|nr:serine hydrolase [Bifidobacterium parmae]PLS29690.1 beta-lactamase class A-like protein [Bifidobacterium parmae]